MITFLTLAIGYSLTRQPWWDEGLLADPAINFRNFGHLGSTLMDPQGFLSWPGVHQYTYWQFPLYLIALGAWFHLGPVNVVWVRLFSVMWACVYVSCWFVMVRRLSRNETLGLLIAAVVALDYAVITAASDGRMEMMCVGLGQLGLAYFVCNREKNWSRAILVAACCGATAVFCHPLGAICTMWIAAVVLLNWRDIRWKGIALATLPYLIGLVLYAAYVMQAPQIFAAQGRAAYLYRVHEGHALLGTIVRDIYVRYWHLYYEGLTGLNRLKGASLVFAVLGTVLLALNQKWRREPLGRTLLLLALISYVGVAVLDNQGHPVYFIYAMPVMSACGALWAYVQWQRGGFLRLAASGLLLAAALFASIGGFGIKILQNGYKRLYMPAVDAVRAHLPPHGLVMGGSELGFALGFNEHLVDDRFLGCLSGKTADVFVENEYYGGSGPVWDQSRQLLRSQYRLVFENSAYRVYARNNGAPGLSAPAATTH